MASGEERTADVVVIGAGPTGENVAQYAHDGGLSVLLVEGELLGGECSYYACMPSKALLRPLDVRASSGHLGGLTSAELDRDALLRRRDEWVSHYDDSSQLQWAEEAGLDVVRGHGRLAGEKLVEVSTADGDVRLRARAAVVLATGSVAVVPAELEQLVPWTSRDATGVVEVPERLLIVGGGVVACEAATWMAALGSHVTMLVRGSSLLAGQEEFAGQAVQGALREAGVGIVFDASITRADRTDARQTGVGHVHGGEVRVVANDTTYAADEVLVAAGRRPNHDELGLDTVGLTSEDVHAGRLPEWLHAIGDAGPGAPLTHMGKYAARVLGAQLAGAQEREATDVPVPQVIFTDPQVSAVGLTEEKARAAGHDVVTARVPMSGVAGAALQRDDVVGEAKLVVDRASGRLLGATFVGHDVAELLHAATVAVVGQVPVSLLRHAVPSYPTASEVWLRLLETLPTELR